MNSLNSDENITKVIHNEREAILFHIEEIEKIEYKFQSTSTRWKNFQLETPVGILHISQVDWTAMPPRILVKNYAKLIRQLSKQM
jgi:hypothetical protein